jgi:hypothetical protein
MLRHLSLIEEFLSVACEQRRAHEKNKKFKYIKIREEPYMIPKMIL